MKPWFAAKLFNDNPTGIILAGTAVFLLMLSLVRLSGGLQALELAAYDRFLLWRSGGIEQPPEVVVVELDEGALEDWGWPVPDGTLARLLEQVLAGEPSAVGVDIYRDRSVPPGGEKLNALLLAEDRVFGVSKFTDDSGRGIAPPSALAASRRHGFADMLLDGDARVRRGLLYLSDDETTDSAIALQLAARHLWPAGAGPAPSPDNPRHLLLGETVIAPLSGDAGPYENADSGGYQYLLDFKRYPDEFASVLATDVLDVELPPALFAGKIVLIGATTLSVKDAFDIPLGNGRTGQRTFGVYLHALSADNLLRLASGANATLGLPGAGIEYILLLLAGALTGFLFLNFRRPELVLLGTLVLGGALSWASSGAFLQDYWLPVVPMVIAVAGTGAVVVAALAFSEATKRRRLMRIFAAQVSPEIAAQFWSDRDSLLEGRRPVPQRLTSTVLFVDLAGSTAVSESLSALDMMDWLEIFFERMVEVALDHGGLIEKFTGDGLMVVFGAPLPRRSEAEFEADARAAARCGLAMAAALKEVNRDLVARSLPTMRMRIGLASGEVSAGTIGTSSRMQYTVIGETANVAARMESYEKDDQVLGAGECRVLMTGETKDLLGDGWPLERVGEASVRGKSQAVQVWRLEC